ncbi:MAG: anti-sigma 24 factor [Ideonella sp. WA131b]|jgi:sigma-E factor negative regulatory protein RseA|nr:anti-sigma 24 factor [Ideonella sp. WA131b]
MSATSPRPHPGAPAAPSPDWLSAAADGDADALDRALRVLREGDATAAARVRADWRAYHLIGDVLRSPELASPPAHDAAFMAGLRARLAAEPVVLAPAAPRPARWRLPAAAVASAAGVAVVAGLLVMARGGGGEAPGAAVPLAAAPVLRDGVLRDARIEEFMRVHQGAAGSLTLLPPGVRQVDLVVTPAPQR